MNTQIFLRTKNQIGHPRNFLIAAMCLLILSALNARAQNGQPITSFWIDDGRGLQKVEHGNPEEIKVVEWQVRLYKGGQSTVGDNNWGLITGKTADSVMRQLKKIRISSFVSTVGAAKEMCRTKS